MAVVQAALLGLTAVLLAAQLKPLKPEYAVYLVLAASIGVGFLGLARLGVLLDTLREIGNGIRIRHVYLAALFKMAGITYIAEFTSGICKDAGYSAVGTQVEMVGKLAILAVSAPVVGRIPAVRFDQAKELVSRKYDRKIRNPYDLEPEEELLIGRYFKEEYGSDFVFVTHYPSKKRPFYAMDDPEDPKFTLSFDLMFRGLEVTTGGQRIHDYREITDKMEKRGMDPEDIASYLMIFKYGMPPHGGLGIGLERLTMRLLDEQNVREASMFPRDVTRLEP